MVPSIFFIWVTLALPSKMARLATIVAFGSLSPSTTTRLALFMPIQHKSSSSMQRSELREPLESLG